MEYTFVLEKPIEKRLSLSVKQGVESDMKRRYTQNLISVAVCLLFLLHPTFAEGKIQYNNVRFQTAKHYRRALLIILSMPYLRTVRDLCGLAPGMDYADMMGIILPGTFTKKGIPLQSAMILSPNYIMTPAGNVLWISTEQGICKISIPRNEQFNTLSHRGETIRTVSYF